MFWADMMEDTGNRALDLRTEYLLFAEIYITPDFLSTVEILRLIARLILRTTPPHAFILGWSLWRRMHQAAAARAHRKSRLNPQL